jgi:hypothetical protein
MIIVNMLLVGMYVEVLCQNETIIYACVMNTFGDYRCWADKARNDVRRRLR